MIRDVKKQMMRGIQNSGFLFAILLMLYSLLFVHTDVSLLLTAPHLYFGSRNFYYFFIITFWMGLSQFVLPMAGVLPLGFFLCDDESSLFFRMAIYRERPREYIGNRLLAAMLSAVFAELKAQSFF